MTDRTYPGRVGLQQRVIPSYRKAFIDTLAKSCQGGLGVLAGEPLSSEGINPVNTLEAAQYTRVKNRYFSQPASPLFFCWQAGFIDWLQAWQPDVLIIEANPRYLSTRSAISWMHRRGRKVLGWGLGAPPLEGPLAGLGRWERAGFLRQMDAVIAYSQPGAEQYRLAGVPAGKVFVAPNATMPAPKDPPPARQSTFNDVATVLFVGRLQSRKRVDLLLHACSALPQTLQPRLLIVGDGPARPDLEQLARQVFPGTIFTGAKHGAEIEPYFNQADLLVLPGTGGLAIQQAMSFALPVIVARGDGTQDDLVRPENGWQIPQDDLPALIAALKQALSDPLKLRQMGLASYRIVADQINVEKMVEVFIQVMHTLDER